jgi:transposase
MPEPNKRLPYPSDLSDKEWEIIEPLIPTPRTNRGKKRVHPLSRNIECHILFVAFWLFMADVTP